MGFKFNTLLRAILAGGGGSQTPAFTATLDNLVNLTGGGTTNVFMTGSSGGNGVVIAKSSASRLTGVAPLYVNFDATATTSTISTNPSHELFFAHDFGDTGAGVWANGVQSAGLTSKNAGYGPVTGHVYETPGTYTYSMVVTDGVNTATRTKTITVQDPDVVYAGALTICISNSNNFAGAPVGATQVNRAADTDMYAAWIAHKASNKRILFCKADTWTASAALSATGLSNMTVGGYGTGVAHTFSSGTMVSVTPDLGVSSLFYSADGSDIRFSEFRVTANGTMGAVCGNNALSGTKITWHKIEVRGAYAAFSFEPGLALNVLRKHEQMCLYECLSDDLFGYAGVNLPSVAAASGAIGTPGIFTSVGHPFTRFSKVRLTGTPPAPLATLTDYYISGSNLTADTFSLSSGPSSWPDVPLALSGTGTCGVTAGALGGGMAGFVAMTNGGIMGCYFDNHGHGEQTLRMPYVNTAHVSNNTIKRPNQGKNVLKIHPRGYTNTIGVSNGYSEKVVVSGNVFSLRDGYSYNDVIPNNGATATMVGDCSLIIGYGNGGEGTDERLRSVIVENNITYASLGSPKNSISFIGAQCSNFTVRNNIADFSMGDRSSAFAGADGSNVHLHFAGVNTANTADPTIGVNIYNNTMYSNLSNAGSAYFIRISDGANPDPDQINVKNNIWYTPHHPNANRTAVYNQNSAGTNVVTATNTDDVQTALVSPSFAVTPPVALTDWKPSGYPVDAGTTVPVLRDFNMATRSGTYDLGAVLP